MNRKHWLINRHANNLLDMLLALTVMMVAMIGLGHLWTQQNELQQARALATRQHEITLAAASYMQENSRALSAAVATAGSAVAVPAGRTRAGGHQPIGSAGLQSLQAAGFLGDSFIDTNRWGQQSWLVVKSGNLPDSLEGIVLTSGGTSIPDRILGNAMMFMGPDGGMVPNAPLAGQAGHILGSKGGWVASTSSFTVTGVVAPTAGHFASLIASSSRPSAGDYLWRTNIGVAEANRMHTSIDMGKHDLAHVNQITGGAPVLPDNSTSTSLAIKVANTIVPGSTPLPDASLNAAPAEYNDDAGNAYAFYVRPDGSNRLRRLDPSVLIDAASWDKAGGTNPRNYPTGTRLIDALPPVVVMASYVARDNTIVPMPACGNPANPDYSRARIFAMPIAAMDYIVPRATTQMNETFTTIPVVNEVSLSGSNGAYTLSTQASTITYVAHASANTLVDPIGIASSAWATLNAGNSWVFHQVRKSGPYGTSLTNADGTANPYYHATLSTQYPDSFYAANYPVRSLIQTACFYG